MDDLRRVAERLMRMLRRGGSSLAKGSAEQIRQGPVMASRIAVAGNLTLPEVQSLGVLFAK